MPTGDGQGGGQNEAGLKVTVKGSGFLPGATNVLVSGGCITVKQLEIKSATELQVTLQIANTAAPGARELLVLTSGANPTSNAHPFKVEASPAPGN